MAPSILKQGYTSSTSISSKKPSLTMTSKGSSTPAASGAGRATRIFPVMSINPPNVDVETDLSEWYRSTPQAEPAASYLLEAATALQQSSTPVAIPTETVYGLAADATRSSAVRGIYAAKQRPSDNPLIVHVASLRQLRNLLQPPLSTHQNGVQSPSETDQFPEADISDPIPQIYYPLISSFWPGPLTILLPNPPHSPLAPEVTSTLSTFGVRMPSSPLARLLIALADRPLAAPSANASTRPSPTTAQHVYHDLKGRIDIIIDGGPCQVGVESTVVDGLSDPPAILRPGGIGIEEIRAIGGRWADVTIGYRDRKEFEEEDDGKGPRAPGMKYRHYAPRGRVLLFEAGTDEQDATRRLIEESLGIIDVAPHENQSLHPIGDDKNEESTTSSLQASPVRRIGIITTRKWRPFLHLPTQQEPHVQVQTGSHSPALNGETPELRPTASIVRLHKHTQSHTLSNKTYQPGLASHHPPSTQENLSQAHHNSIPNGIQPTPHLPNPQETNHQDNKTSTSESSNSPPIELHLHSIALGARTEDVARGLFSALRLLDDELHCDVIAIEGIPDKEEEEGGGEEEYRNGDGGRSGDNGASGSGSRASGGGNENLAAAVMNRLRKAASG